MRRNLWVGFIMLSVAVLAWAAAERLPLDGLAAAGCNWNSCTVANLDDDPDASGSDWATATNNNTSHSGHFSFGTPADPLTSGADLQNFRVSLRENSTCGTGTATGRIELWESNVLVRAGSAFNVTAINTSQQVNELTWAASEITSAANVEVKVFGTKAGGAPAARCAVDIGAVEWNADTTPASGRKPGMVE